MQRDSLTEEDARLYLEDDFRDDLGRWFSIDYRRWNGCGFIGNLTDSGNPNRPHNRLLLYNARRSHVFAAAFRAMLERMRSVNNEKGLDGVAEFCRQHEWPMCSAGLAGLDGLSVSDMIKQAELNPENKNNIPFYKQAVEMFGRLMQVDEIAKAKSKRSRSMEIQEISEHMLVNLNEGLFLVDTGSPTSFARGGKITFAGKHIDVPTSAMGMLDADTLSGYVGTNLDGLVGMNVLREYCLTFVGDRLFVEGDRLLLEGKPLILALVEKSDKLVNEFGMIPTESFMGIPVVTINMGGRDVKVFVDSGAQISYLSSELLEGIPVVETVHDFYPGMGEFDVDVSRVACTLGNLPLEARFGRLPFLLQMTLMMGGVEGILGHDLFSAYSVRIDHGHEVAIRPKN